jgi:hypothetical protein
MQKKKLLAEIFEVVDQSRDFVSIHQEKIDYLNNFIKYAKVLIQAEAPELSQRMEPVFNHYGECVKLEQKLIDAELRTAEDLNDVAARFDVVFRLSEESSEANMVVKKCTANLKKLKDELMEDQAKGGNKKFKIEANIAVAIEEKKKAIEAADLKIQEFISVKEKYNAFKIRRLRHGYSSYGEALSTIMNELSSKFQELSKECSSITRDELHAILTNQNKVEEEKKEEEKKEE